MTPWPGAPPSGPRGLPAWSGSVCGAIAGGEETLPRSSVSAFLRCPQNGTVKSNEELVKVLNAAEVPGTDVVGEPPPPLPPRCRRCVLPWLHRSLCMALLAGSAAARFTSTSLFVSAEIGCRRVYSMGATLAH